jgi:hypothetical protein
MSLINEALKKAQRQRGDGAPSFTVPPMPIPGGPRHPPRPKRPLGLIVSLGAALIAIAGLLGFFLWPAATPPPATPPAHAPVVATPAPVVATAQVSASVPPVVAPPTVTFPAPVVVTAPPVASAPPPAVVSPPVVIVPAPPAAVVAPVTPAPQPPTFVVGPVLAAPSGPPPAPKPDPRIYTFIDALRITGVVASGNPPKVLMNGQVFKPSDMVDRVLGLRLTKITAGSLTFTDEAGFEYDKKF